MARSKYREQEQALPPADQCESILAEKVDDDGATYDLRPVEGKSAEQIQTEHATQRIYEIHSDEEQPKREKFRFSLGELFAVTTFACLALSAASWFPLPIFASVSGVFTLLVMFVFSLYPPQTRVMHLAWWTLLGTYLVATVVATLRVWHVF